MNVHLNMACWRGGRFWLGKLVDYPEIMTQGETLEELEENLRDACRGLMSVEISPYKAPLPPGEGWG